MSDSNPKRLQELITSLLQVIVRASIVRRHGVSTALNKPDFNFQDLQILMILSEEKNVTESELRRILGLSNTTMSAVVHRLTTKGVVQKNVIKKKVTDGRQKPLMITEQGKASLQGLLHFFALDTPEIAGTLDMHDLNNLDDIIKSLDVGTKKCMNRVFGRIEP